MRRGTSLYRNERGMASILTVMILMAILGLISVGFSQLMNREVQRSLDRQLSVESFYAAESGLNDTTAYLASGNAASFAGCADAPSNNYMLDKGDITGDGLVKYSCVSLTTEPPYLLYSLKPGESKIFHFSSGSPDKFYFSWQNSNSGTPSSLGTIGYLPQETSVGANQTGVLRVSIYPVPAGSASGNSNSLLQTASRDYFLYPNSGNGQLNCGSSPSPCVSYTNAGANGAFVSGQCNNGTFPNLPYNNAAKRYCNSVINNLRNAGVSYAVRITAMYSPVIGSLQVADSGNNSVKPSAGNQGIIDATGSGSYVSQRVRAVVATLPDYGSPVNAIWSMETVCKLFRVPVDSAGQYGVPEADASTPNADPSCANSVPSNSGGPIVGGGATPIPPPPPTPPPPPPPPPPPGNPPPPPPPPPPTPVRTVFGCWEGGAFIPNLAAGICRADGGSPGSACQYSDGSYRPGAC